MILQGHVLEKLKEIDTESIDCIVTSPPYWGLREYGTDLQIWDGADNCKHEWNNIVRKGMRGGEGETAQLEKCKGKYARHFDTQIQNICNKCGAWKGELGLEPTIEMYVNHILQICNELYRVLKKTGSFWLNISDTYNSNSNKNMDWQLQPKYKTRVKYKSDRIGIKSKIKTLKPKSLCMIPERIAIALISNGWILRNNIIWHKPSCMPSSVKDRFTRSYEYFYFFTKHQKYYFEQQFENIAESTIERCKYNSNSTKADILNNLNNDNHRKYLNKVLKSEIQDRNMRDVWSINTESRSDAHFAMFPTKLIETPIRACCPPDGIVLDPFLGSGTTAIVAQKLNRKWIGIELNPEYAKIAERNIKYGLRNKNESYEDKKLQFMID